SRAWTAVRTCLLHPGAAAAAFALSLGNHAADATCCWLFAKALGLRLGWMKLATSTPVSNLAASVPLTPGGAGLRENALQSLLVSVGADPAGAAALGFLQFFSILVWAAICAAAAFAGPRIAPGTGKPAGGAGHGNATT
ncbi:MAG: flippase-like domain-containing protein, partial [Kiritimatiellae bacterium]|nr:flippase-like domain-containing protein [Kiritimatiellia bacterium]